MNHEIFLLDLPPKAKTAAEEAARLAFPHARIRIVTDQKEIFSENCPRCLVVLGNPDAASTLIGNAGGSPGRAVIVLDGAPSDVAETVPPEEWTAPLLARAFRSALLEQELVRENVRLRGDLKTVARRISHDLRTPVGCIYTTSDVFKELPPGDIESVTTMASVIKESAEEISQIVDRVSFVLKASADPIAPARVDAGGILAGVLKQLDADLHKAGATVNLPTSWPEVSGVTTWLQVVWTNLIRNAFQHGGPQARIDVTWQSENDMYRFSVNDHGGGVSESRLAGLFSRFDQLHSRHVPGLGLSVVERLVSLQGGQCGYENIPGGGGSFYFKLPALRSV